MKAYYFVFFLLITTLVKANAAEFPKSLRRSSTPESRISFTSASKATKRSTSGNPRKVFTEKKKKQDRKWIKGKNHRGLSARPKRNIFLF